MCVKEIYLMNLNTYRKNLFKASGYFVVTEVEMMF